MNDGMDQLIREVAEQAFHSSEYKKNIAYIYGPGANPQEFIMAKTLGGSPGQSAWVIQQVYRKVGVQMHVTKQVSDDLQESDFSDAATVENVPWMAPVIEVYFEDPLLPTILVMKTTPDMLRKWFPDIEIDLEATEYITALMQSGTGENATQLSLQLKPSMYKAFLTKGETPDMQYGLLSSALSQTDNCTMSYMLHLVLKVFAFASIPVHKPVPITRKQMTHGGKPDVKGRPERPAFRTSYLPKVIVTKVSDHTGEGREFHGRRGHIRWYYDERFVNRKGTWDFIQPVADPVTGKYPTRRLLKVRKV